MLLKSFCFTAPLTELKNRIDAIEVQDPQTALWICRLIPGRCPFERRFSLFHRWTIKIPALCKLNPLYRQLTQLRLRSLSYLAEQSADLHALRSL